MKNPIIGMNIKQKDRMKIWQIIYFLKSRFVGVNRLFLVVYLNKDVDDLNKDSKFKDTVYQKA